MPEGHSIHRIARHFDEVFVTQQLRLSSPQGRFTDGADLLDGHRAVASEAYGKHWFLYFDNELVLNVHLGMYGAWTFGGSQPDPSSWVTVTDALREIGPGATEQFLLAVDTAAAGAVPGGTYAVKVNAYSADEPPEANSGPVLDLQITVPATAAEKPKGWFRWWMAAVAAALVAVVVMNGGSG